MSDTPDNINEMPLGLGEATAPLTPAGFTTPNPGTITLTAITGRGEVLRSAPMPAEGFRFVPSDVECSGCGATFKSNEMHLDCRPTRKEFDALQRDLSMIASGLLRLEAFKDGKPIWDPVELLRIANITFRDAT